MPPASSRSPSRCCQQGVGGQSAAAVELCSPAQPLAADAWPPAARSSASCTSCQACPHLSLAGCGTACRYCDYARDDATQRLPALPPMFLGGHSLGGLIAALTCLRDQVRFF